MSAGGVFIDENPVTEVVPGQVIVIRTAKGTFRTRKLVITAGPWAPALLRTLGVDLPLVVSKFLENQRRKIKAPPGMGPNSVRA